MIVRTPEFECTTLSVDGANSDVATIGYNYTIRWHDGRDYVVVATGWLRVVSQNDAQRIAQQIGREVIKSG